MAEGAQEGGEEAFSFIDKVKLMMYGEQEKEAFLIEKKEKEEKKKAKMLEAAAAGEEQEPKKQTVLGQVKSFFVSAPKEVPKEAPEEPTTPTNELSDATG